MAGLFDTDYELTLTVDEASKLLWDIAPGNWGGNQRFADKLQRRLDVKWRTLTMTGSELDKAFEYAWAYGNGGWQDHHFRPLVVAGHRAGWHEPESSDDPTMRRALLAYAESKGL